VLGTTTLAMRAMVDNYLDNQLVLIIKYGVPETPDLAGLSFPAPVHLHLLPPAYIAHFRAKSLALLHYIGCIYNNKVLYIYCIYLSAL
jgi:hypothetical protein